MPLNTATGELMKTIVHNDHLYRILGCLKISKTMAIIALMFKFIERGSQ